MEEKEKNENGNDIQNDNRPKRQVNLYNEIAKAENYLLQKATKIENRNDLINFYFAYSSVFLPTLQFTVNHLKENDIAHLANFGILIDHLSQNQLNLFIDTQIDHSAIEIAEKSGKSKNEILKLLESISISQKHQITTTILTFGSISRDAILQDASTKFSAVNKTKLWANIFSHFFNFPVLAETLIDLEIVKEAEKQLLKVKSLIYDVKERDYDNFFAARHSGMFDFSDNKLVDLPKLFVGTKLSWLQAMEGIYFCKFLLDKKIEDGEKALKFNKQIQIYIQNNKTSKKEISYRNFNSFGPCPNLINILNSFGGNNTKIIPFSTCEWLVISDEKIFILDIPSNIDYYFSLKSTVTYSDKDGKQNVSLAIRDIGTIIEFGKNPAKFVAKHLSQLSPPKESIFLLNEKRRQKTIELFINEKDSVSAHLENLYSNTLNSPVLKSIKRVTTMGMEAMLAYGLLLSFEKMAESQGIRIDSETWSQIRTILSGVVVVRLENIFRKQKEIEDSTAEPEEDDSTNSFLLSPEEKVQKLYEQIGKSEKEFNDSMEGLKDAGLYELMDISKKVKEILLSGASVEEIKLELEKYFELG